MDKRIDGENPDRGHKVHMLGRYLGTGLCGVMGGGRRAAMTTTDRAAVTCGKCVAKMGAR
jgi:hypothetical protein